MPTWTTPAPPRDSDGPLVYLSSHFIRAKEYLEAIVTSSSDAIVTTDLRGRLLYVSPGAERMLGQRARDLAGSAAHRLYAGGFREARALMRRLLSEGRVEEHETVLLGRSRRVPVSLSAALLKDKDGTLIGTMLIAKDITRRVELEARLRDLAIRDELTGLFNLRHFQERAAAEVQRASRQGMRLSMVLIDLDGFKKVNDRHGHLEGDRVLKHVAAVISRSIRGGVDTAYRYGGDEFILLLAGAGVKRAEAVARRLHESLGRIRPPAGTVPFSHGAATLKPGETAEELLQRADERMYRAKRAQRRVRR